MASKSVRVVADHARPISLASAIILAWIFPSRGALRTRMIFGHLE